MNHSRHSRKVSRRLKLVFFVMLALLIPILSLLPVGRAQVAAAAGSGQGSAGAATSFSWLFGLGVPAPPAPSQFRAPQPISSQAVGFAETRPLGEIAKRAPVGRVDSGEGGEREPNENPAIKRPTAQALAAASVPGGLVKDVGPQGPIPLLNMPSPITTFEGLGRTENIAAGFGNLAPPDTDGDVGPNHYVQQTNLLVRVWNKAGTPLTAPFRLSSLFAALGGQCAAPDNGDPVVLYDSLADRWLLSQFAYAGAGTTPPFHQCIAISKTPDPTGAYFVYDFITPGNEFPDYPKLGVWPDGYYMMVHQFTNGLTFNGSGVYSFDRVKMLAGNPTATYIYFNLNLTNNPEAVGGLLPSDLDGLTPPPVGRPNTFAHLTALDFGDPADGLRMFDFHSDFTTPANSTFTQRAEATYASPLAVAPYSLVTPTGNQNRQAVPQPAPANAASAALDAITDRLMHRMQYRNQGGYETLVTTHTVGAPASTVFGTFRAAPRYYELRRTAGGPYVVQEQGTFAPGGSPGDNISRWMGSAAEDNQGNLAVGFSASSGAAGGNVFPGIRYAGRLTTDPAGSLGQGEATLIAGTGVQTSTGNRWGDYSALAVDPSDDCTFWYTQEYYTAAGQAASSVGWQTRVGNFKFAQCSAPAQGTVHFTVTNCVTNALIQNAIVSIDGNVYGATLANGTYDGILTPGPHTYSVTKAGHTIVAGNFNITNAQITNVPICLNSGSVHFTVTNCATGDPISGANVTIDGSLAGTTAANGTFDADELAGPHTYSISALHFTSAGGNFSIVDGQTTNTPVCLNPNAEVAITKTADTAYVNAGTSVGFNVTLTNNGLATATGLAVTDNLPGAAGTNWSVDVPNSDAGWSVSGSPPNQNLVYTPTTLVAGASTHVHVISGTSAICANTVSLDNTASFTTGNDGSGQASASVSVLCPPVSAGPVTITATAATPGPTDYPTVKAAFDAINAGTHQGSITIWIFGNTTETVAAVLNASGTGSSVYTAILMLPSGGARTVSGSLATPLIDLAGADNVNIDGLNSGGNALTFSNTIVSTTAGTSTIRFINGATNNKVTNCTILGSSTATLATATGNVLFSTSTIAGGNSNNTISKNNIGAAGANTPTKGIVGIGSASPNNNTGNLIDNNNVFDFFLATTSVSGIQIGNNNNNWTISNNRIYQTATRTFTTAASRYSGIAVASAGNTFTITGNTIGFSAANGTGTTTITGTSNEFRGIVITNGGTNSSIQGNTISGINQTTSRASTTTDLSPFIGIQTGSSATDGPANIGDLTGNTIGSLDGSSTIVINETSITAGTSPVQGILDFNFVDPLTISNNKIGSITINNGGSGTAVGFRGILIAATAGVNRTVANNTVGGTAAGSITDNIVGSYGVYGIQVSAANATVTGNTVRNLAGNSNGASIVVSSGIISSASTGINTFSRNVIHSLTNASGAGSNSIYAISCSFPATANVVERNLIHSLSMTSSVTGGQLVGIISTAAASTATYKNNMIRLGVDAAGNPITLGLFIAGLWDGAGTNNVYFNSSYVGGSGVASASTTFALFSQVTTNTRNYRNNILWNARSNASGAGKNYAINVAGTTPNPAGLTSSNNDLYATGTGGFVGLFNAADQLTLANWQAATGQDANSMSVDPQFVAPNAAAATVNLHILPSSPVVLGAIAISGITNDFDNDLRPVAKGDIGADQVASPTAAAATISGVVTTVEGVPLAGVTVYLEGGSTARTITDSRGEYRFTNVDVDNFYTVKPAFVNYHFEPAERSFSLVANTTEAVFTATRDAVLSGNAIDGADFFVRQHYLDFLGREPDEGGFNFWSDEIRACGSDSACVERKTINVSAAYFLSIEFQQTGGLVDSLYRASYDRRPSFAEFMPDTAVVARNVIVGQKDWAQTLAGNKDAFVAAWVERPQFRDAYNRLSNSGYVDTLLAHADGFKGDRDALVSGLNSGALTRTTVLRQIVENEGFINTKRNAVFVMMEYFGYLRRDPDDAGYQFWLDKLNQFDGNFERAEMVKAFLVSGEYRSRFAP